MKNIGFDGAGEGGWSRWVLECTHGRRRVENVLVGILRRRLVSRILTAISTVEKLCVQLAQV